MPNMVMYANIDTAYRMSCMQMRIQNMLLIQWLSTNRNKYDYDYDDLNYISS